MTLEQLQYFVVIVETGTFLGAAEELHLSQSSLSKSIQRMERELNVVLFDRSGRSARLTEAGHQFYNDAKNVLSEYTQLINNLNQIKDSHENTLKLGLLPIQASFRIASRLKQFRSAYPKLDFQIYELEDAALLDKLLDGTLDLAILRSDFPHPKLSYFSFALDHMVCLLPKQHPLAAFSAISLTQLKPEAFILMPAYTAVTKRAMSVCQKAGYVPERVRYCRTESIISSVAEGEGISLLMESNIEAFSLNNVVIMPLLEAVRGSVAFACLKEKPLSLPAKRLIELFKK